MKAIVCVKQVPDTSGKVAVNPDGTLNRASMATITNPDDLNAVEAALTLKDTNPEAKVIVVSMGPAPAAAMLRELLAMGCDGKAVATALRVSFCADNDEADVDALLDALAVAAAERLGAESAERLQSLHQMKKDYFPDG